MGGGAYSTNNRVNAAVAAKEASRASTPVFTYNTGDPLPEGYRSPAKFYSEMTPDEQRANDELRRIAELNRPDPSVYVPTTYSQAPTTQNYGAAPIYDSPQEAFSTYGSFFEQVQRQIEQTASVYNYNKYDPADFARAGMSGPRSAGQQAASNRIGEYLTENNIPPFIDVEGQRLYFTTGLGGYPSGNIEDDKYKAGGSYEAQGPVGTYSTVHIPSEGLFDSLHPALRGAIALATGGMSEAFISATQAISGETLHLNDWLNLANAGMEIAKASQPTTSTGSTGPRTQAEMAADGDIIFANDTNYWETSGSLNPISGATTTPESFGSLAGDLQEIFEGLPFDLAVGMGSAIFEEDNDISETIQTATEAGQSTTTITDEGEVELQPTGDTPDMLETVVDLEQPELASEDITADPIEEQVITPPTLPEETEDTTAQEETAEAGSGGQPAPESTAPTEPTDDAEPTEGTLDDILLRQVYEAVLAGELPLDEYIRMGGVFVDELRQGIPANEVYSPVVEPELPPATELDETGEPTEEDTVIFPSPIFEEDPDVIDIISDINEDTTAVDPIVTTDPVDTTDPIVTTDPVGTGEGTDTGEGSGDGAGTGSGTGSGTGRGTGISVGSATRTTDSLFKDMLQLETQIGSTQELLPFSVMPVPTRAVYKVPQANPIQQFLQQQEMQRIRSLPQGMLTNDELLKRFPY